MLLNLSDRAIPPLLLLTEADRCGLGMKNERCWGGLDEQFPVGVDEQDLVVLPLDEQYPDRSSRLGLDEQGPRGGLDEQDHPVEGRMNSSRWRGG